MTPLAEFRVGDYQLQIGSWTDIQCPTNRRKKHDKHKSLCSTLPQKFEANAQLKHVAIWMLILSELFRWNISPRIYSYITRTDENESDQHRKNSSRFLVRTLRYNRNRQLPKINRHTWLARPARALFHRRNHRDVVITAHHSRWSTPNWN